ncbi:MAG: helix-turn-helix transcriptional regulator [candidate division KSB1 bacterium]|nr:helix-turn-helix transcriptional regulator [candidate division KSB1 bacterium]MDZ7318438.1 helix-turn-helix transcriptional regulator [candidate division KSB1 bacterium]MDZ7342523.1 helix-turn-helix transcriptional regulator [candidate division KSB1 bacterium]
MRYEIGKRIRLVRDKKGITQSELGEKLGIQFQHVSKYERGETVPTWENLIKLHEFYDVNINWLLTGKGTMFVSPLTYSVADTQSPPAVRDLDSDDQLDEIIAELRNDQELKNLIYDYIKNYRQLRLTTSKLTDKVDQMKQKL